MSGHEDERIPVECIESLLVWFRCAARRLPWRGERDAYRIWVSEVMLQQTRVETVAPYYRRWLERFPDLRSLAEASREEVLKLWEGLGYYGRALRLREAARRLVAGGTEVLPATAPELRRLPGVGPYIAAAVASISRGAPVAAVDGNVLRVITRLRAIETPIEAAATRQRVGRLVEGSFHGHHPGWVNQAWMELGALCCTPGAAPGCSRCPVRSWCRAEASGQVERFPVRKVRRKAPLRRGVIFVAPRDERILLVRRGEQGLLGGLWELPNVLLDEEPLERFCADTGLEVRQVSRGTISHAYSHFRLSCRLVLAQLEGGWRDRSPWDRHVWADREQLEGLPRPRVHLKALAAARERGWIP
jgi:A/G-specific adenine glycosylase